MATREFSESPAQPGNVPAISSISGGDLLQEGRHNVVGAGSRSEKTMNDDDLNSLLNDKIHHIHWHDSESSSGTSEIKAGSKKLGKSLDLIDKAMEEIASGDTEQGRKHLLAAVKDLRQGRERIDEGLDDLDPFQKADKAAQLDIKDGEKDTRTGQRDIFKALAALKRGDTDGALDLLNSASDNIASGKDQIDQAQKQLQDDRWGRNRPVDDGGIELYDSISRSANPADSLMQYAAARSGDVSNNPLSAQDFLNHVTNPQDLLSQLPNPEDIFSKLPDPAGILDKAKQPLENLFTPPDFKDPESVAKKIFDPFGIF